MIEDYGFLSDACPSYTLVQDVLAASVKSNKTLWNERPDKSALCSIFTILPRLRTMSFYFFQL
jgi:hypothetical protein